MSDDTSILRRIFPKKSTCPNCTHDRWSRAGYSRGGLLMYRRCTKCKEIYRVAAIAHEEDRGGLTSTLVLW